MTAKRLILLLVLSLFVVTILAACGGTETVTEETQPIDEGVTAPEMAAGSERGGDEPPEPPEDGRKVEVTRVVTEIIVEESAVEGESFAVADTGAAPMAIGAAGELSDRSETAETVVDLTLDQNSRLTAGEVDDNVQWDDYLLYLRDYSGAAVIPVDVRERHQIIVQDSQGNPVLGARVGIEANGQEIVVLRTHSDGRAYFFPHALDNQADSYTVNIQINGATETFIIKVNESQREWIITHPAADQLNAETRLDVLFLIDATGSMADEINQLKENIRAIAAQIDALPSQPDVRFGMVAYRDRGDAYVARTFEFTPHVEEFAADLDTVYADGGGDYPEDLNEALSRAIHEPEWRVEGTVSLIFLVADAPPHLDYGQQNHYAVEMLAAAERGIKIYPIASSGLDSQGEYIFRQLAQTTGGRFIFLTYGASGPGSTGTETNFAVSDYSVSSLDALVVKIVEEELSYLSQ